MTKKASQKTPSAMFEQLRGETAGLLGYSLDNSGAVQALRLDRVVALRIELDGLQAKQLYNSSKQRATRKRTQQQR
jgi:hypothetical protein